MKGLSEEALLLMSKYDWPGNIRELQNVIEYVSNYSINELVQVSDLRTRICNNQCVGLTLEEKVRQFEIKEILNVIEKYGDTKEGKERAAKELGISRASLYRKIKNSQK